MNKESEWTMHEQVMWLACVLFGVLIMQGVYLQWGTGAALIAVGAYGLIGTGSFWAICERKKSIAEFNEKRKQGEAKQERASTRYEEMRAQNAATFGQEPKSKELGLAKWLKQRKYLTRRL